MNVIKLKTNPLFRFLISYRQLHQHGDRAKSWRGNDYIHTHKYVCSEGSPAHARKSHGHSVYALIIVVSFVHLYFGV